MHHEAVRSHVGFPQPSGETGGPPAVGVRPRAAQETKPDGQEHLPSLAKLRPGLAEKPRHISLPRGRKEKGDAREREVGERTEGVGSMSFPFGG